MTSSSRQVTHFHTTGFRAVFRLQSIGRQYVWAIPISGTTRPSISHAFVWREPKLGIFCIGNLIFTFSNPICIQFPDWPHDLWQFRSWSVQTRGWRCYWFSHLVTLFGPAAWGRRCKHTDPGPWMDQCGSSPHGDTRWMIEMGSTTNDSILQGRHRKSWDYHVKLSKSLDWFQRLKITKFQHHQVNVGGTIVYRELHGMPRFCFDEPLVFRTASLEAHGHSQAQLCQGRLKLRKRTRKSKGPSLPVITMESHGVSTWKKNEYIVIHTCYSPCGIAGVLLLLSKVSWWQFPGSRRKEPQGFCFKGY